MRPVQLPSRVFRCWPSLPPVFQLNHRTCLRRRRSHIVATAAAQRSSRRSCSPTSPSSNSAPLLSAPAKAPSVVQEPLEERLAALPPDQFLAALASASAFRRTPSSPSPSSSTCSQHPHPKDLSALRPDRRQVLAACRLVVKRRAALGGWRAGHLVALLEQLAEDCRGLAESREVAAEVAALLLAPEERLARVLVAAKFLTAGVRAALARELPACLPRLMYVLASLEFDEQEEWSAACRLMHSHLWLYSGAEVALLVRALVKVDTILAGSGSGAGEGGDLDGIGTSSGGSGLGARQLAHPAMRSRLEALVRDGGIAGDDSAGVLLGLVASRSGAVTMDEVAVWLRRALQERQQLSPQGWVQLLQAVANFCDRCPDGATEVVSLLERYQAGLLGSLCEGVAAQAPRLPPHVLTDAAGAFSRLRYRQPDFLTELARSTSTALRSGSVETRDVSMALYACAFFGHRDAAVSGLFAEAGGFLGNPRLRSLRVPTLARVAWSYAVAGGCGLLPGRRAGGGKGPGDKVDLFLQDLSATLVTRRSELSSHAATSGPLCYAVRVWTALRPSLAPRELQEAVKGGGRGGGTAAGPTAGGKDETSGLKGSEAVARQGGEASSSSSSGGGGSRGGLQQRPIRPSPPAFGGVAAGGSRGDAGGSSGADGTRAGGGAGGGASGAGGARRGDQQKVIVSELQKQVFRELRELGYEPRMETKVGQWSVDMTLRAGGVAVAVEVDGPTHFCTSPPPAPLGSTRVRDACLRAAGWQVVALDFRRYDTGSPADRAAKLKKLVERAVAAGREGQGEGGAGSGGE